MEDLMLQYLREMRLTSGMNRQRATEAWNTVSGASRYTLSVSFERGVMTCAISSSLVRNQTNGGFAKINKVFANKLESIVLELNEYLYDDGGKEGPAVKVLILK